MRRMTPRHSRRKHPAPAPVRLLAVLLLLLPLAGGCGGGSDSPALPELVPDRPAFQGSAAYALVDTQLAFGPRVPGTAGHRAQLLWMTELLEAATDAVELQSFTHTHTGTGDVLELTNLLARFRPDVEERILFLAHWDTRPTSDAAETPERRALPVPGANDGASGTAVLLELARILSESPPPVGVDILLVDGEDYGPTTADMFLGARHFAANLPDPIPAYGVLLDMVGDRDPRFPVEGYSSQLAPAVTERVWGVAHALGYGPYFPFQVGERISDDHLPLNNAGLPTTNVIDFDYPPWHTPEDDLDQVAPSTLEMVGEVVLELIFQGG